jgi:hypothetical protein
VARDWDQFFRAAAGRSTAPTTIGREVTAAPLFSYGETRVPGHPIGMTSAPRRGPTIAEQFTLGDRDDVTSSIAAFASTTPNRRRSKRVWRRMQRRVGSHTAPSGAARRACSEKGEDRMTGYDITQTNLAVEELLGVTDNPRHRFLLLTYNRHRYLEMAGRYEEIFVPEMTVDEPVYHFHAFGINVKLEGRAAVEAVYREWTESGQHVFYMENERLAVGDYSVLSTGTIAQQTPGRLLAEAGVDADVDAMYLLRNHQHMIWPYDDRGRLIGEDVWEVDETTREIIKLDPGDVLTRQQADELLRPFIKALPAFEEVAHAAL